MAELKLFEDGIETEKVTGRIIVEFKVEVEKGKNLLEYDIMSDVIVGIGDALKDRVSDLVVKIDL